MAQPGTGYEALSRSANQLSKWLAAGCSEAPGDRVGVGSWSWERSF